MKIQREKICKLDCSIKENRASLMKMIKELPYFHENEITDKTLEKMYWSIQDKTNYKITAFMPSADKNSFTAFCKLATCNPDTERKFMIVAPTLREIFIKFIAFTMYNKIYN